MTAIKVPRPAPAHERAAVAEHAQIGDLLAQLSYLSAEEQRGVRAAFAFAEEAHSGQSRMSGAPYITHPLNVALTCAAWHLDAPAIMAALLHDVLEDCDVTPEQLQQRFGAVVADLVGGLTKLERLEFASQEETRAESFRKMLLAMARDIRVILIKLADRLHNMRTLAGVPRAKQERIARETSEIYAPIAHRLGLDSVYRELQDLSFRHTNPWRHRILEKAIRHAAGRFRDLIARMKTETEGALAGMSANVQGREKTPHSVYRKMREKHLSFARVTDIFGFRVILPARLDCYLALGKLHQFCPPLPGRFKDYIAVPKRNGYQSLHTTLATSTGAQVEFQIRSEAMHRAAEAGAAAHWLYKAREQSSSAQQGAPWLRSLLEIGAETQEAAEFLEHVKVDLFPDEVYVFTPKGRILALPRGATPVDFAYAIHSDIGEHAAGAVINGSPASLRALLRSGDTVEILRSAQAQPDPQWLGFVRSGRARSHIRHYLRTLHATQTQALGARLLVQALRREGFAEMPVPQRTSIWQPLLRFAGEHSREDLLHDLTMGRRAASIIARRLATLLVSAGQLPDPILLSRSHLSGGHAQRAAERMDLDGSEGSFVKYAPCCCPLPGDTIMAYAGLGEGLVVHRQRCINVQRLLKRDQSHWVAVDWADQPVRLFDVRLQALSSAEGGILPRIAATAAASQCEVTHIHTQRSAQQGQQILDFTLRVKDRVHLAAALRKLRRVSGIERVQRAGSEGVRL